VGGAEVLKRISFTKCRELLGSETRMTNDKLESLRDEIYALAEIMVNSFVERHGSREVEIQSVPLNAPEFHVSASPLVQ
jgi:hypothetical protein